MVLPRHPPRGTLLPHRGKQHWGSLKYHQAVCPVCSPMVGKSYCPSLPACHHPAQCSTKNTPTRWTRYPWDRISPRFPAPYDHPNWWSAEHAGLCRQIPSLENSQLRPFTHSPLCFLTPGALSNLLQTGRPTQCVRRHVQDSGGAPVSVSLLTPAFNGVRPSNPLHIRCFSSPAPAFVVPCSPMPVVTSVSESLVDRILHRICPD